MYRRSSGEIFGRFGYASQQDISSTINPFYEFTLRHEPEGFRVAVDEHDAVIGTAISWVRAPLWFLSHLFILPGHQDRGVGKNLLDQALRYAAERPCMTMSVITFAFNPVSVALYTKAGMYPREPVYLFSGNPCASFRKNVSERACPDQPVQAGGDSIDRLCRIDENVLGMPRRLHHEYLLLEQRYPCYLFSGHGGECGYAYVSHQGGVGPVAAPSPNLFEHAFSWAIFAAARQRGRVSAMVPGSGKTGMRVALEAGMKIRMSYSLLSSQPFGDWNTYALHSPGLL